MKDMNSIVIRRFGELLFSQCEAEALIEMRNGRINELEQQSDELERQLADQERRRAEIEQQREERRAARQAAQAAAESQATQAAVQQPAHVHQVPENGPVSQTSPPAGSISLPYRVD